MTQVELEELRQLVPKLMKLFHQIEANSDKFEKRLDSLEAGFGTRLDSLHEDLTTRFASAESGFDTSSDTFAEQVGPPEESVELPETTKEIPPHDPAEIYWGIFGVFVHFVVHRARVSIEHVLRFIATMRYQDE
ncbi:unnamed protein product [Clonostachys solani]|uniref:Uncharacterized protein n=1 Tax=Clonostachys solani TaxID=160281 RepID=A0A9N9ZNL6_9HYPO|nr:unnamed protein product [Clonostachys solani]